MTIQNKLLLPFLWIFFFRKSTKLESLLKATNGEKNNMVNPVIKEQLLLTKTNYFPYRRQRTEELCLTPQIHPNDKGHSCFVSFISRGSPLHVIGLIFPVSMDAWRTSINKTDQTDPAALKQALNDKGLRYGLNTSAFVKPTNQCISSESWHSKHKQSKACKEMHVKFTFILLLFSLLMQQGIFLIQMHKPNALHLFPLWWHGIFCKYGCNSVFLNKYVW